MSKKVEPKVSKKEPNITTAKIEPKVTVKNDHRVHKISSIQLFDRSNYILMGVGLLLIIVGYLLMMGGKSENPNVFNADEIYSFRRITLAPMMVLAGFIVEIIAIMKRPKSAPQL